MMSLLFVCLVVGVAVAIDALAIYWLVRKRRENAKKRPLISRLASQKAKKRRETIRGLYRQAGYQSSIVILYLIMAGLVVVGLVVGRRLHASSLLSIPGSLLGAIGLPVMVLRVQGRRRQAAFMSRLPGALDLMSNALRAGLGINAAFEVVAKEMPDPIGTEFSLLVAELNLGGASLDQALEHLVERNASSDTRLFAQAILINKQVGGNLAEVLDNLDRTMRERAWLHRELSASTAEQWMSAWILSLLPVAMALAIFILSRNYMMTLFTTVPGYFLVAAWVVLEILGIVTLRQIIRSIDFY